jgi:hypothetical protein
MNCITVCPSFVNGCAGDRQYAINVLYLFIQDNDFRLNYDSKNKRIFDIYKMICKNNKSKEIAVWLDYISHSPGKTTEPVAVGEECDDDSLPLKIAKYSVSPKIFLAWSAEGGVERISSVVYYDREMAYKEFVPNGFASASNLDRDLMDRKGGRPVTYSVNAGPNSNIIIGSQLENSLRNMENRYSVRSAETLKKLSEIVESSGDVAVGEEFDRLTHELGAEKPRESAITGYVGKIFDKLPDVARLGKSTEEIVKLLFG